MTSLLSAHGLAAGYLGHPVVEDVELEVGEGEVVALLGPNGAGKTTTLMTLAGDLKPLEGEVRFLGRIANTPLHRRAGSGLSLVTEERSVFGRLTVRQNLRVGRCHEDAALALFPELHPLLDRRAGLLSGGEQQMLTLARALARQPRVLLADEISLGLAPLAIHRLLEVLRQAANDGLGVLMVEQHVAQILSVADRVYVMRRGRIVLSGAPEEVAGEIEDAYLSEID